MKEKSTALTFIILLAGLTAMNLAAPSREYSENENRTLEQKPSFSAQSLFSGRYAEALDRYTTDQFFLRDYWVGAKTLTTRLSGQRSSGGVYFGRDGYLLEMFDTLNRPQYEANLNTLGEFERRVMEKKGIRVRTMLVPTAAFILRDKLPSHTAEIDQQALLDQAAQRLAGFVDCCPFLESHSGEYIFYKTDHHWTSLGAYYAYEAWRDAQGLPAPNRKDFAQEVLSDSFYGTTWSKANLYTAGPDVMTAIHSREPCPVVVDYNQGGQVADSIYASAHLSAKDKYAVYLDGNKPVTHIQTKVGNGRSLLLIKDSYANTFVQMPLRDYQDIHLIDLRFFRGSVYEYLEQNGVTDVLVLYGVKNFSADTTLYYLTA